MKKKVLPYSGSKRSLLEMAEIEVASEKMYDYVYRAKYRQAYDLAFRMVQLFPMNRFAIYHYAVYLGDCAEWASEKIQKVNAHRSAKIFRNLLSRTRGIDPRWVRTWKNEYYWFSKQPLKQWQLGLREVRTTKKRGHYSMGVGAVSLSLNYFTDGNPKRAVAWALKAKSAWESYFKYVPDYYNSYVWYAQSLGLSGDLPGMEKALKKAAKLSKRPLSYREFVDARKTVLKALKVKAKK